MLISAREAWGAWVGVGSELHRRAAHRYGTVASEAAAGDDDGGIGAHSKDRATSLKTHERGRERERAGVRMVSEQAR